MVGKVELQEFFLAYACLLNCQFKEDKYTFKLIQVGMQYFNFLKHKHFIIFWLVMKAKCFENLRHSVIGGNSNCQ